MQEAATEQGLVPRSQPTLSLLVYAPKVLTADAVSMARLRFYLCAEFPDYDFVVPDENPLSGNQSAVGIMLGRDGTDNVPRDQADRAIDIVGEALKAFADQAPRLN